MVTANWADLTDEEIALVKRGIKQISLLEGGEAAAKGAVILVKLKAFHEMKLRASRNVPFFSKLGKRHSKEEGMEETSEDLAEAVKVGKEEEANA